MPFTDATRSEAERLIARYAVARSALLPLLHLVQSVEGHVSEDGIGFCAELLDLTKAEVGSVATFYTMYKREPVGDYLLSVCTNPTCQIAGGQKIYESYVEACGGKHTDPEGAGIMVEHAECLGICDAAPVVTINYENYSPASVDEAMDLLAKAKAGEPPESPLSKHTPETFKAVERELSGIDDGTDEHLIEAARLQATMETGPSYRTGETSIPVLHPGGDPVGHGGTAFREASAIGGSVLQADRTLEGEEREHVEDIADEGGTESEELAEQVAGEGVEEPPPVDEQPELTDDQVATATEQTTEERER
jgi:NADH-quinone oxidoreductase subunit E